MGVGTPAVVAVPSLLSRFTYCSTKHPRVCVRGMGGCLVGGRLVRSSVCCWGCSPEPCTAPTFLFKLAPVPARSSQLCLARSFSPNSVPLFTYLPATCLPTCLPASLPPSP